MFDNLSKFLADEYSQDLSSWFVGYPVTLTELKPKELFLEPIRADSVVLLKSTDLIIHGEFQTDPDDDIAFRMADYALRIFRAVMSALCLEKDTIEQILRRDIMRESAMYQEMQSWAKTDAERGCSEDRSEYRDDRPELSLRREASPEYC
jgi:predicted transposase YdaD